MDEDLDDIVESAPAAAIDAGLSAAILLMLLEDNDSAALLQHLEPAEVKSLAKGMFEASGATENDVEGALDRIIRVLMHVESDKSKGEISHIYLHGATALRKDLAQ